MISQLKVFSNFFVCGLFFLSKGYLEVICSTSKYFVSRNNLLLIFNFNIFMEVRDHVFYDFNSYEFITTYFMWNIWSVLKNVSCALVNNLYSDIVRLRVL